MLQPETSNSSTRCHEIRLAVSQALWLFFLKCLLFRNHIQHQQYLVLLIVMHNLTKILQTVFFMLHIYPHYTMYHMCHIWLLLSRYLLFLLQLLLFYSCNALLYSCMLSLKWYNFCGGMPVSTFTLELYFFRIVQLKTILQRKILHFVFHKIYLTALVTSYCSDYNSENHISATVVNLNMNISDKLKD